jgi:hypothetical protein
MSISPIWQEAMISIWSGRAVYVGKLEGPFVFNGNINSHPCSTQHVPLLSNRNYGAARRRQIERGGAIYALVRYLDRDGKLCTTEKRAQLSIIGNRKKSACFRSFRLFRMFRSFSSCSRIPHRLASKIRLNGVSATRSKDENPPSSTVSRNASSVATAPSPGPPSASELAVQHSVDAPE